MYNADADFRHRGKFHQHDKVDYVNCLQQARTADPQFAKSMKDSIETLELYRDHGCEPGGCMWAILANDLDMAVRRADGYMMLLFGPVMLWIIRNLDPEAYGSPEKVAAWMENASQSEAS